MVLLLTFSELQLKTNMQLFRAKCFGKNHHMYVIVNFMCNEIDVPQQTWGKSNRFYVALVLFGILKT